MRVAMRKDGKEGRVNEKQGRWVLGVRWSILRCHGGIQSTYIGEHEKEGVSTR